MLILISFFVGYHVHLHVGNHNVVSTLCEGSERLTEWKSESMTYRRTNELVLEMLLHLKIMVVEVVGAKSEGLADATIMSPHPSGPPPTVLIHSKCIHCSPQIGHVLVNCEVMGFAIYVFLFLLDFASGILVIHCALRPKVSQNINRCSSRNFCK